MEFPEDLLELDNESFLPLIDFFDDFQFLLHDDYVFEGMEGAASAQIAAFQAHPLRGLLMELLGKLREVVEHEDEEMDLAWNLQEALQATLARDEVQECMFEDELGMVRFSSNAYLDEFVFSALSVYDMLLDLVRTPPLGDVGVNALNERTHGLLVPYRGPGTSIATTSATTTTTAAAAPAAAAGAPARKAPACSRVLFADTEEDDEPAAQEKSESAGEEANVSRRLPRDADTHLKAWLLAHTAHPFPDDDEKDMLVLKTGLTRLQISNYFINARRRLLERLPDGTFRQRAPGPRRGGGVAKASSKRASGGRGRSREKQEK
eukprot:m.118257 g.118257  ORF g.118257 m.118257 type:complete len:321 (-) comp14507_c2_seq1:32-994(-)